MTVQTMPDVEGGLRTYLRANTDLAALIGTRCYFGIPDAPVFPLVVVRRVGGGDDIGDAPIEQALVQIDCWGDFTADGVHGNKAQAEAVRRCVRGILFGLTAHGATHLDSATVCYGAVVLSDIWLPDPDDDRPRYSISAQITARAA